MTSIGQQLSRNKGVGPGFDAVRIGLALSILFVHCSLLHPKSFDTAGEPLFPFSPLARWGFESALLPMFFALSGFLVAASAERLPLTQFLINRALRILPALSVEIVLSALVLGPLLTALTLREYATDPLLPRYLLNIAGDIQYRLPGLFLGNPQPDIVNGSLWTVPHEISCYLLLTGAIVCGLFRRRRAMLVATLALFGVSIAVELAGRFGVALPYGATLSYAFVTRGAARLVPLFLTGILFYQYRDAIPYRAGIALAGIAVYGALCAFGSAEWAASPLFGFVTAPVFAYAVVYVGLSPRFRVSLLGGGDYSYGIYLYGFPIQQALIQLMPGLRSTAALFAISLLATGLLAVFSWHAIEKPVLRLRRRFSVTARLHTEPRATARRAEAAAEVARYPATIAH